jgi:hypothetical protein
MQTSGQLQAVGQLEIPETFSSVYGLGASIFYFPIKGLNRWGSAVAAVVFIGLAGLALAGGLYVTYIDVQAHGPAVIERNIILPLVLSIIFFLIGAWAAWSAYTNWNRGAVFYENGFAYHDRKGLQTWRWEEVALFYQAITRHYTNGIYTGTTYLYTLQKADGSRAKFDNAFSKAKELGRIIAQKTSPFQYKRAVEAYNAGKTIVFGPVGLNKNGIAIGNKVYPWKETRQVSIAQGYLRISKKDGGWFSGASASAASIPNLEVLLLIIDQVVGLKTGRQ